MMTPTMMRPSDTSYEIICAADRREARNGYLEFEAQPPMMTPYTSRLETAKMNSTPTLMLAITQPSENGITTNANIASVIDRNGARKNTNLSAPAGTMISLSTYFSASATDCSRPHGPTTFGPRRIWTAAQILRSP